MEKQKPLEILVVEDSEENMLAAQEYFNTRTDVCVDFAVNYDEAIQKLDSKTYAGAILDIEIPKNEGIEPEKLGIELGKKMDVVKGKYRLPHVFLSGGYFHHERSLAKVFIDEFCAETNEGEMTEDKTYPAAWKKAYETLLEICPGINEIFESKLRARGK